MKKVKFHTDASSCKKDTDVLVTHDSEGDPCLNFRFPIYKGKYFDDNTGWKTIEKALLAVNWGLVVYSLDNAYSINIHLPKAIRWEEVEQDIADTLTRLFFGNVVTQVIETAKGVRLPWIGAAVLYTALSIAGIKLTMYPIAMLFKYLGLE